jgi:predicted Zn-dependent protease
MQAKNYAAALPLLQGAVKSLKGAGPADPYEGYANYNLGYTLIRLGQCKEAIKPLKRAQRLEPARSEPARELARAHACA